MNAIVLDRLSYRAGNQSILEDVSLAIEAGTMVGMLGANGAGKTTLMRLILGLATPVAGQISILGQPASRGNRAIGYIPQHRTAINQMRFCGYDFVASACRGERWGLPILTHSIRREVDAALGRVGATELARRPLSEMSGGERQRLLLAQALLGNPQILLLDEPLISLDPHHQHSVVQMVRQVQQELGITVILSAHELNPLLNDIDQVLYLASTHAAIGSVDAVIRDEVLSRLYGSPVEVLRLKDRIFVMAGNIEVDREAHCHDHDHGHEGHDHDA